MTCDALSPTVAHRQAPPPWPAKTNPQRAHYPSDVTDELWEIVAPLLARSKSIGRPNQHHLRDVLDAVNYRWQTGCSWRMLPHDFPPWTTVYTHVRNWQRRGVLREVRAALVRPPRQRVPEHSSVAETSTTGDNPPGESCLSEAHTMNARG